MDVAKGVKLDCQGHVRVCSLYVVESEVSKTTSPSTFSINDCQNLASSGLTLTFFIKYYMQVALRFTRILG